MSHVFISYSRKDSETVDRIASRLMGDGLNVWLDRGVIKGGDLWREAIVEAVDNAYACVLMVSPDSAASENVRKEMDLADGASKDLVPVFLAPVKLPARLRYQLAGIQWIEYFRDPEVKYAELLEVLQARTPKQTVTEAPLQREVEIVIKGVDLSKFGLEEQQKLLKAVAEVIDIPLTDLKLTTLRAGSVHAFVNMPASAAYRLKTAALNQDARLINYGIDAIRLTGDRHFVFLKTGRIAPLKAGRSGGSWFIGGLILSLLLFILIIALGSPLGKTVISSFFATATPTPTSTFTSTPSSTPSATETPTSTPSQTPTPTETLTPTRTRTPTFTPSYTPTFTKTFTPTPTATAVPNASTTFSDPIVSTNHFGCIACDSAVIIQVVAADPDGVSGVELHYWLINQITKERTKRTRLQMIYTPGFWLPTWKREIQSMEIPGANWNTPTDYWFQFYFLATDKSGAQTRSPIYRTLVTFSTYAVPR